MKTLLRILAMIPGILCIVGGFVLVFTTDKTDTGFWFLIIGFIPHIAWILNSGIEI